MDSAAEPDRPTRACTSRAAARVAVVVVNYNTAGLTVDCLASLATEPGVRAVVVDNASPDGSGARIAAAIAANGWGGWTEFLPAGRNGGFAAGNNVALRAIFAAAPADRPDYVLLLNPDTVVRPGAVARLVEFLDARPRAGIAGSQLEYPDGTLQESAFRFPTVASELENGLRLGLVSRALARYVVAPVPRADPHRTHWVCGASMLVRREVFERVGFLDEGYFLYFEEVDFCRRAARAGWECWAVPASRVVHLLGQATGMSDAAKVTRRVPRYWLEARRRYFVKHHGPVRAWAAAALWAAARATWRVRRRLQAKPDPDPPHLLADFVRFNLLTAHPAPAPEVTR
ncbi:glycosyltransferase family 2 protein [Gemmata sp.]|uniref:glycosyltransferase family 2 protein n=1 Tax=Gemmata sp. TaxID=1914242 RepID=UPI003F71F746